MGNQFTPKIVWRIALRTAILGASLACAVPRTTLAAAPPATAPAATAPAVDAAGRTRTYDVYDLFWYSSDDDEADPKLASREARSAAVVDLFTQVVAPGSWAGVEGAAAGASNTMSERDGRLVVTAPAPVHADIEVLLRQLRDTPPLQGVSLDCQFLLVDAAFVKANVPEPAAGWDDGAAVRGVGLLKARTIVEAARRTPGAVVVPAPPQPLSALPTSVRLGEDRRVRLPSAGASGDHGGGGVEVDRPAGFGLSVRAVADARRVTLDLAARSGTIDLRQAGVEETEGAFRGTFAVGRAEAFVVRAPLVHAFLKVAPGDAGDKSGKAGGPNVVREPVAVDGDHAGPSRYLLVVGTVRTMSLADLTLLVGGTTAEQVAARYRIDLPDAAPPPPFPNRPGQPPFPPPVPPAPVRAPQRLGAYSRVTDLRALLLGSEERPADRQVARAKRLDRILAKVKAAAADDRLAPRVEYGHLIVTALQGQHDRIAAALEALAAERELARE